MSGPKNELLKNVGGAFFCAWRRAWIRVDPQVDASGATSIDAAPRRCLLHARDCTGRGPARRDADGPIDPLVASSETASRRRSRKTTTAQRR